MDAPKTRTDPAAALASLFPASVISHASCDDESLLLSPLWPEEQAAAATMRPARLREFSHGRHCARLALGRLGSPPRGIALDQRAPLWPPGIVGSIAHAGRWAVAAVASSADHAALGVDIELSGPLEPEVLAMIGYPEELQRMSALFGDHAGRLLFSAKESAYKCLWPLCRRFLEFRDIELVAIRADGGFKVCWRGTGELAAAAAVAGSFAVSGELVLAGSWVAADLFANPPPSGGSSVDRVRE